MRFAAYLMSTDDHVLGVSPAYVRRPAIDKVLYKNPDSYILLSMVISTKLKHQLLGCLANNL